MTAPRPYTPKTLADYWQCSEKHVRNLIQRGELDAFRLGHSLIRIRPEAVEAYECKQNTSSNSLEDDITLSGQAKTAVSGSQQAARMRLMRSGS